MIDVEGDRLGAEIVERDRLAVNVHDTTLGRSP
jgi:hypothetical protein